ncbi:hypothetical protein Ancab_028844 [Ancistrocladus abbreviatus]
MKKVVAPSRKSGNFLSPGTPNYWQGSVGINKGWSSERVPLPTTGNKRQVGGALLPLNNGKALPSKWKDAERWIFSPVAGDVVKPSYQQLLRRPKSKSGPLGPPGVAYCLLYSPDIPMYEEGNLNSLIGASPFSAGVIVVDGLSIRPGGVGRTFASKTEPCIARSASVHGCTDLVCQSYLNPSQDGRIDDDIKDPTIDISRASSRRDMATQMSPVGSSHSSPRKLSFSPSTPSILPIVEVQSLSSLKSEVRDEQVDEQTAWEVSAASEDISKAKREEAKITEWENLQKAKAEAAVRKLKMKLEKKRSSSLDKIMNKLRSAQKKAQEMRSAVLANQGHQVAHTSRNPILLRRTPQMGSLTGCFTCHAF